MEVIDVVGSSGSSSDLMFDEVVGALEGILMDEDFLLLQRDFCERYAGE